MKKTDKNSPKNRQSDDTLIYILLFIVVAVLVGGLVWYFWSNNKGKEWNFSQEYYEKELGKKLTSPKADEVSKLISSNRSRIKTARRVLEDKVEGRKLSAKEKEDIKDELDKVSDGLDKLIQNYNLEDLEKNDPDTLALFYDKLYEQGKVALRLKVKTATNLSSEQCMRQVKVQDEWINSVSEEETKDIMDTWVRRWYEQARKNIIESGREKLLKIGILLDEENGKKIKEPTEAQLKPYQIKYENVKDDDGYKTVDLSKPLSLRFDGYWGFLTEKDKKDSSEGSEVYGLTKSGAVGVLSGSIEIPPAPPKTYKFRYIDGNNRLISIGFEKKLFFNRLGYGEWMCDIRENGSRNYLDICFEEIVETIAHELAHAIVNTIKVSYKGEEGGGHGRYFYDILEEIEEMIKKDPDFPKFKTWWEEPRKEQREWAVDNILFIKKSHWGEWKYWYIGGGVGILVVGLAVVVIFWDRPTSSKKNAKN